MYTLAVDTAADKGSLAIFRNKVICDEVTWQKSGSHSEFITLNFKNLLSKHNLSLESITRLAVNTGPGSFTGIRVGINFVRALGFTHKIPIYNLSSLDLLAFQVRPDEDRDFYVSFFAFRDLFYCSKYSVSKGRVKRETAPQALTGPSFIELLDKPTLVLGNGPDYLKKFYQLDSLVYILVDTQYSQETRASQFVNTSLLDESPDELTTWIHTIPLYIRASEAEEKLKSGELKSQV